MLMKKQTAKTREDFCKLQWRSRLLNQFVSKLDDCYEKFRQENSNKSKLRSPRCTGLPSLRTAPNEAPKWTLWNDTSTSSTSSQSSVHVVNSYNTTPSSSHTPPTQPNTIPISSSNDTHTSHSGFLTASARMLHYSDEQNGDQSDNESIDDDPEFDQMICSAISR